MCIPHYHSVLSHLPVFVTTTGRTRSHSSSMKTLPTPRFRRIDRIATRIARRKQFYSGVQQRGLSVAARTAALLRRLQSGRRPILVGHHPSDCHLSNDRPFSRAGTTATHLPSSPDHRSSNSPARTAAPHVHPAARSPSAPSSPPRTPTRDVHPPARSSSAPSSPARPPTTDVHPTARFPSTPSSPAGIATPHVNPAALSPSVHRHLRITAK